MQTSTVQVKSKGKVLKELEYSEPETLQEAFDVDGEEKIFSLYSQKRKADFLNNERRKLTSTGVPKEILEAMRSMPREELVKKLDEIGLMDILTAIDEGEAEESNVDPEVA